jgi:hypothetical protein
MLGDKLIIPINCQGYLDMYHGIDVSQTPNYIKVSCFLFVEKCYEKVPPDLDKNIHDGGRMSNSISIRPYMDKEVQQCYW